ncbi:MAG: hypothetical protein J6V01_03740 [Clostridia bacterium]|nr:hypothetical protein [Clostridia bacterium]
MADFRFNMRLSGKTRIAVIAAAAVLVFCFILSVALFYSGPTRDYATASLTLNYDGINNGLDPYRQALNLSSFVTEDLVAEALGNLDMRDKYKAEDVLNNLTLSGNTSNNTVERILNETSSGVTTSKPDSTTGYHPSTFTVRLWRDFDKGISARKLRALLGEIVRLLSEKFVKTYSRTLDSSLLGGLVSNTTHEYLHRLEVDCDVIDSIYSYSSFLAETYPYYSYEGSNYQTIAKKCSNLITDKADRMRSSITVNGLTNNAAWMPDYYRYNILLLGYTLDTLNVDLKTVEDQIAAFELDSSIYMSSGDSVIKVESKSKETYESLVERRLSINSEIASVTSDIEYFTQRLQKLQTSNSSTELYAALRSDFETLESKIAEISSEFNKMMEAQNAELAGDMVTVSDVKTHFRSVFSLSFIVFAAKRSLIVCLPIIAVLLIFGKPVRKKKKITADESVEPVSE